MPHSNHMAPIADRPTMRRIIAIAFPLVMAASGHALRLFADRVMLAHYSREAIAASMPAGLMSFCLMSLFLGTAGYTHTFVAQYVGAGNRKRAGLAIWQGLYLAAAGGVFVATCGQLAEPLFAWMGHAPAVQAQQVPYFRVLCRFSIAPMIFSTLAGFWSGRGKTRIVMVLELLTAAINIALNRILIFGALGFPRMGIVGAGVATGISATIGMTIALALFLNKENRREFGTLPRTTFDLTLFRRLIRFGLPNGLQFMLDLAAFNMFIVLLGRMGDVMLEAVNIAFGLNALAFLPLIGLGTTASIMVGQGVGAHDIPFARQAVKNAVLLAVLYNSCIAVLFIFFADPVLALFARTGDTAQVETLHAAKICLRFITAYLAFDALYIVYGHAIKGAGDTRFSMTVGVALSWGTLVLPCWTAATLGASPWTLWSLLVIHVIIASIVFLTRYHRGKWQSMRVIETTDNNS
jgi:MATE family multidrug resistance protein